MSLRPHEGLLHCTSKVLPIQQAAWQIQPHRPRPVYLRMCLMQSVARPSVQAILSAGENKQRMSSRLHAVKQQTLQKLQSAEDPTLRDQARQAFMDQEKSAQKLRRKHRQDLMADETVIASEDEAPLPLLDDSEDALAEGLSGAVGPVMKVGDVSVLLWA